LPFFYVLNESVRILMADDDPIMREFAGVYLSTPSAEVVTVEDGRAALNELASGTYDLLLLDIDMPVMNGFETLEAVRRDPRDSDLPVIVITGREDVESIDRAFALGATSFVVKPVNWRLLAYQIKYVLRAAMAGRSQRDASTAETTGDVVRPLTAA
jgi:DNA-binding response OmpR family regulator